MVANADLFWYWPLVEAVARAERFPAKVPSADVGRLPEAPVGTVYEETYAELERTSLHTREKRRYSVASDGTTIAMTEKDSEQGWIQEHEAQAPIDQLKIT